VAQAILASINVLYQVIRFSSSIPSISLTYNQRLEEQGQNKEQILQLADDIASIITYIEDVEQFARISQLKEAMEGICPLIEDTTNFILRYTSQSETSMIHYLAFQCITNASFRSHSRGIHFLFL
jgi:hypothetical protein